MSVFLLLLNCVSVFFSPAFGFQCDLFILLVIILFCHVWISSSGVIFHSGLHFKNTDVSQLHEDITKTRPSASSAKEIITNNYWRVLWCLFYFEVCACWWDRMRETVGGNRFTGRGGVFMWPQLCSWQWGCMSRFWSQVLANMVHATSGISSSKLTVTVEVRWFILAKSFL